jgi:hypothetical protein
MPAITTIGLDLAKKVFHVHGVADPESRLFPTPRLAGGRTPRATPGLPAETDQPRSARLISTCCDEPRYCDELRFHFDNRRHHDEP